MTTREAFTLGFIAGVFLSALVLTTVRSFLVSDPDIGVVLGTDHR